MSRTHLFGVALISLTMASCSPAHALDAPHPVRVEHDALFAYCVSHLDAPTVGDVFCAWALRNGYPRYAPGQERSCVKAWVLGNHYAPIFPSGDPRNEWGALCDAFIQDGPSTLPDW